jgi:hypothetical protein
LGHASAEQMRADIVTDDFEAGFVGGHPWTGRYGLRDFIAARSMFFDKDHELVQILEVGPADGERVRGAHSAALLPEEGRLMRRPQRGVHRGGVPHLVVPG